MVAEDNTPFFVLGSQRSGTTMLRLMLNRHPRLMVPHESKFMIAFNSRLDEYGDGSDKGNTARLLNDIAQHKAVVAGDLIADTDARRSREVATFPQVIDAIIA